MFWGPPSQFELSNAENHVQDGQKLVEILQLQILCKEFLNALYNGPSIHKDEQH